MANQVTVTGKTMGGITVTTKVIPNVASIVFPLINGANGNLRVFLNNGTDFQDFDISAATTLTGTIASGVVTLTIS